MEFKCLNTIKLNGYGPVCFTAGKVYNMWKTNLVKFEASYKCIADTGDIHHITNDYLERNFKLITCPYPDNQYDDPESRYWKNATTYAERFSNDDSDYWN